jgi:hypothetical protein
LIYDILAQKEEALFAWQLLLPIGLLVFFLFSKDKKKPLSILLPMIMISGVILIVLGTINGNAELNELKTSYLNGKYESVSGKVTFESFEKQKNDGVDSFVIGTRKIIRFDPKRDSRTNGCWTGSVMKQGQLLNSLVKIDFINYPKWTTPPFKYGDEKVDVLCILRIERIGNNPSL